MESFGVEVASKLRVHLRQSLPVKSAGVIEKVMEDGRVLVSDADSATSLKLFQRELLDAWMSARDKEKFKPKESAELKVGSMYLLKHTDMEVYRITVLTVKENLIGYRLVDFGFCGTASIANIYCMESSEFDDIREATPFVKRINLPTDEILQSLGLPTASMLKQGDVVDIILLTACEPQLGVFSFPRSDIYRAMPKNLTDGFNDSEKKKWLSLFETSSVDFVKSGVASNGFSQLRKRETHVNRLALVSFCQALDKVYVHDLESSLRLTLLRERLELIYGDEKRRKIFAIPDMSEISSGDGCVAFHNETQTFVRVHIVSIGQAKVDVAPVDVPVLGNFTVTLDQLYYVPEQLFFPRQCFAVRMVRDSSKPLQGFLSTQARCVLPSGTAVILNSEPDFGLVEIRCPNAPEGVLEKIGFHKFGEKGDTLQALVSSGRPKFGIKEGNKIAGPAESMESFVNLFKSSASIQKKKNKVKK